MFRCTSCSRNTRGAPVKRVVAIRQVTYMTSFVKNDGPRQEIVDTRRGHGHETAREEMLCQHCAKQNQLPAEVGTKVVNQRVPYIAPPRIQSRLHQAT